MFVSAQISLADLPDSDELIGGEGLCRGVGGVVEAHEEEVDKEVLAVGGFAVSQHHEFDGLVLLGEPCGSSEGKE